MSSELGLFEKLRQDLKEIILDHDCMNPYSVIGDINKRLSVVEQQLKDEAFPTKTTIKKPKFPDDYLLLASDMFGVSEE